VDEINMKTKQKRCGEKKNKKKRKIEGRKPKNKDK
jgi:hypothetical protein